MVIKLEVQPICAGASFLRPRLDLSYCKGARPLSSQFHPCALREYHVIAALVDYQDARGTAAQCLAANPGAAGRAEYPDAATDLECCTPHRQMRRNRKAPPTRRISKIHVSYFPPKKLALKQIFFLDTLAQALALLGRPLHLSI